MNCYLHPDREASAYCRTCGRPLCAEDQREIYGVVYCQECLARQLGQSGPAPASGYAAAPAAAPYAAVPPVGAPQAHVPNAGLATLLGFIPGVGAVYNGQYLKAFLQVVIFAFLISIANWVSSDAGGAFIGLSIAGFYFYMVIDSYRSAKAIQAGEPPSDFLGFGQPRQINAPIAAIVLIVIGAIFLLHSMGFFYLDVSRYVWPAVLIALGVFLLLRQKGTSAS
jgi:hypothetical protein